MTGPGNSSRFANNHSSPQAETETMQDEADVNNSTYSKVKNFTSETNNNTGYGKYEPFNVLSEYGDSIYTTSREVEPKGQFYISIDILEELCDQIKSLQKRLALLRKDLVKAGVLKAA